MKFSTVSLILALSAAPAAIFVHGTNHHSVTCDIWSGVCDDDRDDEEERRTLLGAQFDAVRAASSTNGHGAKRPTRKLSKNDPLPPRPVFCDEFTLYWNITAWRDSILIQGSAPPKRGIKTCLNVDNTTDPPLIACRGDNAQAYTNLYTDLALTQYGGRYADNELVVQTEPDFVTLVTGSIEVKTPDFGGEILFSNLFGERYEITAGSRSYLGASGTVETNTEPFKGEIVGEFIVRCELTNPSNP
jgi:hypothetical protein